jgi:hypothetical protein
MKNVEETTMGTDALIILNARAVHHMEWESYNEKFLEVQEPFFKKVLGRRRH